MDISAWLRELGLERYEQAFQEGEIDLEGLPRLTDGDLKELGIPLGPRKKLLKAIETLEEPRKEATAPGPAGEAERRQLTVMFCDLVGSTGLALLRTLEGSRWRPTGKPTSLFYDPPWTLPFLRRNEVAIPVTQAAETS